MTRQPTSRGDPPRRAGKLRSAVFCLLAAAVPPSAAPAGPGALHDGRSREWRTSASLPLGAEYHLVREDPKSGGVQALVRFQKGYSLPPHGHEFDETLIVLKGRLRVRMAGEDKVLGPGGYAVIPAGASHALVAEGWKGVVMILTTNGPYALKPPAGPAAP